MEWDRGMFDLAELGLSTSTTVCQKNRNAKKARNTALSNLPRTNEQLRENRVFPVLSVRWKERAPWENTQKGLKGLKITSVPIS